RPSNAAYKRSTRAACGCSDIRTTSPWSESLRVVLVLKAFAHHVRAHILQDGELVAARILEEQARAGRDLEGTTFGLPSSGSELLGFRLQVLDFKQRQARRRRPVVGQQILRPFAQSKRSDFGPHRVMIPQHFRTEDIRVVLQVAIEVRSADVEVEKLAERGGHGSACGIAAIRFLPSLPRGSQPRPKWTRGLGRHDYD